MSARPRNGSTRQWRKLRARILARDNYTCRLCGRLATHVDHIHPISLGGSDHPANLQATCTTCNLRKGARTIAAANPTGHPARVRFPLHVEPGVSSRDW